MDVGFLKKLKVRLTIREEYQLGYLTSQLALVVFHVEN